MGPTIYVELETHFDSTIVENNNTYYRRHAIWRRHNQSVAEQHADLGNDDLQLDAGHEWSDRILSPHRHIARGLVTW